MEKVKIFLTLFSSGKSLDGAWKEAGFTSLDDLRAALKKVADLLPDRRIAGGTPSPGSVSGLGPCGLEEIIVHSDGAARGNPGPASAAAVAYSASGEILGSFSEFIGKATNNEAEYKALILGIELATDLGADSVVFRLDSELVVKQIRGEYKIKKPHLAQLAEIVKEKASRLAKITYAHVPRSENMEADRLANEVLDRLKKEGMV
ncbi:MAG: ribonuclease HI family protein [Candidatus Krumholzibacteriota bacterium]|nr:ribonuclease HI family protein [Candidatus Krumholzibacteriota bacterium]